MSQVVVSTQFNPYLNIAVENYLLSLPPDGGVTLYLWQNQRTVVIGQNQNPYAECNVEQLEKDGGYLMRRRTGGGAVFHDLGNINFSFIVPNDLYDQTRQFAVLQRAVAAYGLETEVSGRNDVLVVERDPSRTDGGKRGRKFSGNAFSKGRYQRLHHGTILIRTDMEVLQRYLKVKPAKLQKHGVASVQSRVVNLSELNPDITAENIKPLMIEAFEQEYGAPLKTVDFDILTQQPQVQELYRQFASPEWKYGNWQRFEAQRSAQFEWGGIEVSLVVDEASYTITSVTIASDSLFPDIIHQAKQLLTGASTLQPPVISSFPSQNQQILKDIFSLLYQ